MQKYNHTEDALVHVLKKQFGYSSFRTGQLEVIQSVLSGQDTLLIQSTGGGKSLCYQLPSLIMDGITVVVSPLISLMDDQIREARLFGRKDVIAFHSGLNLELRKRILYELYKFKLLFISPEGLQSEHVQQQLSKRGVSLFVVDEAHCISQWGYDFRLDYLTLKDIRQQLGQPVCVALTATATLEVKKDIIQFLNLAEPNIYEYSVDRPNIKIHVETVKTDREKHERIVELVKNRQDAGMIYCSSRAKTEELVELLTKEGIYDIASYHGGLSAEERFIIQQQFLEGQLKLICATNAFGMGVNKPDIRYVIHYHFPSHLEAYVQEMGRCSRDGKKGLSYVITQDGDEQIPFHFIEAECLTKGQIRALVLFLKSFEEKQLKWRKEDLAGHLLCSEQALDVALHHVQEATASSTDELVEEVSKRVEQLKIRKTRKVGRMLQWLKLGVEACRREAILHYFSQSIPEKGLECCDLCDTVLKKDRYSSLYTDVDSHHQQRIKVSNSTPYIQQSWQSKLKRLWPTPAKSGE